MHEKRNFILAILLTCACDDAPRHAKSVQRLKVFATHLAARIIVYNLNLHRVDDVKRVAKTFMHVLKMRLCVCID